MAVYRVQDTSLTAVADAIRAKAGTSDALTFPDGFVKAVGGIQASGGGAAGASPKEVNFYDYDGTLLHAYTVAEARRMAELPAGPTHKGLVFQGWNWSLGAVRSLTRAMNIGAMYITDDGTTRLYITLQEGRTSPMLGICVNGTVTVDWGDGTEPDVLTGTSVRTAKWTPNHAYAAPGDYVIRLTVEGEMAFTGDSATHAYACILRYASGADRLNEVYRCALQKVEIGDRVTIIGQYAFYDCHALSSVTIPDSVASIDMQAFRYCDALISVTFPDGVTVVSAQVCSDCLNLTSVTIPASVTKILQYAFYDCYALSSVIIPDSVASIGDYAFYKCYAASLYIPGGAALGYRDCFSNNRRLAAVYIEDGVSDITARAFDSCPALANVSVPASVTNIEGYAFQYCYGMAYYDFTACTAVPTLAATSAFTGIPADCEIRVPAALYDEWIAATNWSTYADYIKAY